MPFYKVFGICFFDIISRGSLSNIGFLSLRRQKLLLCVLVILSACLGMLHALRTVHASGTAARRLVSQRTREDATKVKACQTLTASRVEKSYPAATANIPCASPVDTNIVRRSGRSGRTVRAESVAIGIAMQRHARPPRSML